MKKLLDYIILIFGIMVFCATLANSAAVYYYDNTTGNDLDDGLSPTNAWQTASRLRTTIAANDDTYLFNGGQEFSGRFLLFKNGWKISSYGTGKAILKDGIYSADASHTDGSIYNLAFNHTNTNVGQYPISLKGGSGYKIYNNTIDCNEASTTCNGINTDVTTTALIPSHDNSIYNNTISECFGAIFLNKGTYNSYVYSNTITTAGNNSKDGILTGDSSNSGNIAYDNYIFNNTITCSDVADDNSNGINIGYNNRNAHVYNNYITGRCGAGIQYDAANDDDNYIYNNIVIGSEMGITVWANPAKGGSNYAHILNNTIIATSDTSRGLWLRCGSGGTLGTCEREGIEIKNNIITSYDANYSIYIDVGDGGDQYIPDLSNNVYYNLGSAGTPFKAMLDTTPYTDLTTWQTAVSETGSMLANAALGDDHLDASYKPESDFPSINKGLTFDSIFTTDYDGYTRVGLWDIGAYEFHQGGTPGNRVTLKRITIK